MWSFGKEVFRTEVHYFPEQFGSRLAVALELVRKYSVTRGAVHVRSKLITLCFAFFLCVSAHAIRRRMRAISDTGKYPLSGGGSKWVSFTKHAPR